MSKNNSQTAPVRNHELSKDYGIVNEELQTIDGREVHVLYRNRGRRPIIPGTMMMSPTEIITETISSAGACGQYCVDLIHAAENFYRSYSSSMEENGENTSDELHELCHMAIEVLDWNDRCQDPDYGYPAIWWEGLQEPLSGFTELLGYAFEIEGESELAKLGASLQMNATMAFSALSEYTVFATAALAVANARGQVEKVFVPSGVSDPIYLLVRED